MTLSAPSPRREKILLMGPFGSGKTTAWLNIAKWSHQTGSTAQFYAIDSDGALEAFLQPGTQYAHLDANLPGGNVHWATVFEWTEYKAALDKFGPLLGPEDWLIVDFMSNAWDAVQDWFVTEMFKSSPAEFFLEARKAKAGGNPLDGWKDWQYINKEYKGWAKPLLYKMPGHRFLTAQAKPIGDADDKSIRAIFGAHGVRPTGQKEMGHQVHTVLNSQVVRQGEVYLTTIKDREREPVEGLKSTEFALDYLVNVGGWQL